MTETIIERLERAQGESCGCTDLGVFEDAAREIERLTVALTKIATMGYAGAPDIEMRRIARAALAAE